VGVSPQALILHGLSPNRWGGTFMQSRPNGNWLWKIVTNPAFEVVAAIVVVLLATWYVIGSEALSNGADLPLFGTR